MSRRDPLLATAVIASGASLSSVVHMASFAGLTFAMPAAWDAASITFQGSTDGVNFYNLYDDAGNEVTATVAAGRLVANASAISRLSNLGAFKIRSGTSGVPVNQTADRTFSILLKD